VGDGARQVIDGVPMVEEATSGDEPLVSTQRVWTISPLAAVDYRRVGTGGDAQVPLQALTLILRAAGDCRHHQCGAHGRGVETRLAPFPGWRVSLGS